MIINFQIASFLYEEQTLESKFEPLFFFPTMSKVKKDKRQALIIMKFNIFFRIWRQETAWPYG